MKYAIVIAIVWVLAIYGWVMNIVSLIQNHEALGMVIARAVGIFVAPLGAVLGFF